MFLSVFIILFLRRRLRVFLPPIQLGVPALIFDAVDAPDVLLDGAAYTLLDGAADAPDTLLDGAADTLLEGAADALLEEAADTLLDGVVEEVLTGPKKCS